MSRLKSTAFIAAFILLGLLIASQATAVVCTVPGTHSSIQAAVSDPTCDPINVAAGVFIETGQIVINRNLTITGAGIGSTIIKPTNDTGSSGDARGWFLVNSGFTFNLSNVTLDGTGRKIWQAIRHRGQGTINDCSFKNIKYEESGPSYAGTAVVAFDAPGNIDVIRCTFEGIGRVGVLYYGSGKTGTFNGNNYTGKGTGDWLDYAVEIGAGASATISNNTISNNLGVASSDGSTSAGILATDYYGPGTSATVNNNTITNCTDGIAVGYSITDATIVVAHNNSIYGNTAYGINNVSTAVVVNAEYNWWGDSSGPGPVGPGTGDNVSPNVDYDPWLQIYWKDYNGGAPGGYMPDIDQNQDFDKVQARTEENGNGVSFSGSWTTWPTPPDTTKASGGTLRYSNDLQTPASCSFTFHGTSIRWIGFKQYNMGISEVWIDGQLMGTVDLYTVGSLWKQVLYTNNNLSHGQHTITIKPTNQKNQSSSGLYTGVDAFDVDDIEHEYCAPVAEANSLWWLDKKDPTLEIFGDPYTGTGYIGGDINQDGNSDVLDLVQELAIMMKTNVGHTGTTVEDEQTGIDAFLAKYQLGNKLYEHTAYDPEFSYIEEEVERSQDVKLDLGFWHILDCVGQPGNGSILWQRVGGHAITVAGVDSENLLFAISDPDNDAAETGGVGVIRPVPGGHPLHPNDTSIHNIEANASHDIYTVVPSASPGGIWALKNYPGKINFPIQEWGQPTPTPWPPYFYPCEESMIITEIEAAVIVSPIICGNAIVEPGETCDPPGSLWPPTNNACRLSCTYCGDGIKNNGEQCDDGNANNNDGCRNLCVLPVCGDGIKDPNEACDDGNVANGDGCSSICALEAPIVTQPNGGEVIPSGSVYTVKWNAYPGAKFDLKYSLNNGSTWKPIASNVTGTTSYNWTVPKPTKNSPNCLVKVIEYNASGTKIGEDKSNSTFTIEVVKVTSPDGGETLKQGTTHTITWTTNATKKPVVKVKLFYSTNSGTKWSLIATISNNPGTYDWRVPNVSSTKCRVKVKLQDVMGVSMGMDTSNADFTISP